MDLSMPRMHGTQATREVLAVAPETRVVVLTSFAEADQVTAALASGAVGYLLKDCEPDVLVRGIREAADGGAPLSARAATALLPQRRTDGPLAGLSVREREVLALVAEGLPNKTVARRLGISEKTVKTHLTRVFTVLGVGDRTSAALYAQRHGLQLERSAGADLPLLRRRRDEPPYVGEHDRLHAVAQPELGEQVADVGLHRRLPLEQLGQLGRGRAHCCASSSADTSVSRPGAPPHRARPGRPRRRAGPAAGLRAYHVGEPPSTLRPGRVPARLPVPTATSARRGWARTPPGRRRGTAMGTMTPEEVRALFAVLLLVAVLLTTQITTSMASASTLF